MIKVTGKKNKKKGDLAILLVFPIEALDAQPDELTRLRFIAEHLGDAAKEILLEYRSRKEKEKEREDVPALTIVKH